MESALKRLSRAQSLGFYNCCEMTTAFLLHKKEKKTYNFFSIFVWEERVNVKMTEAFLVLSGLGEQALIIFAKTIRMDLSGDQCAMISDSLGRTKPEEMERVQQVCAAVLYSRWKEYLETLRGKKSGLHGIQTSGYQALIFQAIRYVYREQTGWEREVMDSLSLYEEDMCNWYKSVVELSTVFFIHMSQLFLLLCVGLDLGFCPGNELRHMLEGAARHMEKLEYLWMDERQKTAMERCLEELLLIFK